MPRPRELPDRARVVIIGGGVGGASIAYHLAQLGERDVILVDRNELTSGSTFHSAGLVGQLRGSVSLTRMMMDSVELYRELDCGWVECGGIRLACTPEREQEVLRQVAWAQTFGLPLQLLSPDEAQALFPLMVTDGVRCASYLPTDGYLDPSLLTYALIEGARAGGVQVFTHTRVDDIVVTDGRVRGVKTQWGGRRGRDRGQRRRHVRRGAGTDGRGSACRWSRLRTSTWSRSRFATARWARRSSICRRCAIPDLLIYFREEGGGLVMGGYERDSAPWALDEHHVDRIAA